MIELTLLFISNYYSNYGEYQWKITDIALIKSISEATPDQLFESPVFQISKLLWKLQITVSEGQQLNVSLSQYQLIQNGIRLYFFDQYIMLKETGRILGPMHLPLETYKTIQ